MFGERDRLGCWYLDGPEPFFMPQDLGCLSLTEKGGRTEEPTVQEGGCGDCCEEG